MKKRLILISITICFLCFLTGCQKAVSPSSTSGFFFDTFVVTTVYDECSAETLNGIQELCSYYESLFSPTVEGSDIWKINHAGGSPVSVSEETAALLTKGLYYSELTDGIFDITIHPVSSLWNFHESGSVPDANIISDALSHVCYKNLHVENNIVTLTDPLASVDVGALAKGYIADKIKSYLREQGISSALINLGGNICLLGSKPDGTPFVLGIEKPFSDGEVLQSLRVSNTNLVTSGVYERYFYEGDILQHHLLDGRTGYPLQNHLYSVSILGPDGLECDLLSTVCFLLGEEKGLSFLEQIDGYEGCFINDAYQLSFTSGFPE